MPAATNTQLGHDEAQQLHEQLAVKPHPRTVWWQAATDVEEKNEDSTPSFGSLWVLDQANLPQSIHAVTLPSVQAIRDSIRTMQVRGACVIGVVAGYGMAIGVEAYYQEHKHDIDIQQFVQHTHQLKQQLDAARPTAVNLMWATARQVTVIETLAKSQVPTLAWSSVVLNEAHELAEEDVSTNHALAKHALSVLPKIKPEHKRLNFLHHCNTGLGTVEYGTALGVIREAHANMPIHVWVDETRPRLQGSRMTAWELATDKIDCTLIPDSAAGLLMYNNKVDVVCYGADRTVANGDTANKVGTHNISILAHTYKVPVLACVPTSTIDLNTATGRDIHIEERSGREVTHIGDVAVAPVNVAVYNPSFDVTPAQYITAIVTEVGVCHPPFEQSLADAKKRADELRNTAFQARLKQYASQQSSQKVAQNAAHSNKTPTKGYLQ